MINKVIIVGNIGADPDVKTIGSGVKVATIRVATSEKIYNKETKESKEHTEWHTIILWRYMAEVAEKYLRKGSQVYIEGKLRTRSWEDRDGGKHYATEIVADDIKLLGRKPESATHSQYATEPPVEDTDDLPF